MIAPVVLQMHEPSYGRKEATARAIIVGPLAVHITAERSGWVVTHIRSGRTMRGKTECCAVSAMSLANKLKDLNWDFDAPREKGKAYEPPNTTEHRRICLEHACPIHGKRVGL